MIRSFLYHRKIFSYDIKKRSAKDAQLAEW